VQMDGDVGPRQAIAEYVFFAVRIANAQGALLDETAE
jgi:hypothetical protein